MVTPVIRSGIITPSLLVLMIMMVRASVVQPFTMRHAVETQVLKNLRYS